MKISFSRNSGDKERGGREAQGLKEHARGTPLMRSIKGLAVEAGTAALILTVVFTVFFGVTVQHGNDMYPAIRDGDVILYYRTGNLVNTEACVYKAGDRLCVGRVAATEGTVISMTGDMQLTFNGIYYPAAPTEGIYDRTYAAEGQDLPLTVREGHYFVLGDNRSSAQDSRICGQISSKNMRGRIVAVLRRRQI